MKREVRFLGSAAILATCLVLGGYFIWFRQPETSTTQDEPVSEGSLMFEFEVSSRSLIVLVDGAAVYVGSSRVPRDGLEAYIAQEMKQNRTKTFIMCGSDTAQFGDVMQLIERLKKQGWRCATCDTKPVPSGHRLNAVCQDGYRLE